MMHDNYKDACRRLTDSMTQAQRDAFDIVIMDLMQAANTKPRDDVQRALAYASACIDFANTKAINATP